MSQRIAFFRGSRIPPRVVPGPESAYRFLTIECGPDLKCSLAEAGCLDGLKPLAAEPSPCEMSALRTAVTDFLSQQFSDIDFLADKLHCLSVCYFDNTTPGPQSNRS